MNIFANIANWVLLATGAVSVAEQTKVADTGQGKQQFVLDLVKNEAGLTEAIAPSQAPIIDSVLKLIINGIVLSNNIHGLFPHAGKPATSGPLAPAAPASK